MVRVFFFPLGLSSTEISVQRWVYGDVLLVGGLRMSCGCSGKGEMYIYYSWSRFNGHIWGGCHSSVVRP